jgi:RNA polymerase sigma factor (sigma-70 family)
VDDFELIRRWRAGDNAAGNELFHRHFVAIRRFFRNKADRDDAEDLIQRTFLQCVESFDGYQGDGTFRSYLFAIARFVFFGYLRRRIKDGERRELDLSMSSVADFGLSPSVAFAAHEQHGLIATAMRRIPVDFQITLELYYWEQLTGPEIAEVLQISPTTVRTRLLRARTALREMLGELGQAAPAQESMLEASVTALRSEL